MEFNDEQEQNHRLSKDGKEKSVLLIHSLPSHCKPRDLPSYRKPCDEIW